MTMELNIPHNLPPPSRRRDKPQLSCNFCRIRKLRCDRLNPCSSCRHRNLSCTYPEPKSLGSDRVTKEKTKTNASNLADRIGHLEGLITSLLENSNSPTVSSEAGTLKSIGPDGSDSVKIEPVESFGHISLHGSKATYVDDTHWSAILDGISEIKNYVQNDATSSTQLPDMTDTSDLLFPHCDTVTREDILAGLPPKELSDKLVAEYFDGKNLPMIHGPSFIRQYKLFWNDTSAVPIMWIGKLYGILSFALMCKDRNKFLLPNTTEVLQRCSHKITQCLVLGKYDECPPDTVETLSFALGTRFANRPDPNIGNLILLGVVIRISQRMGYHRDSSFFPKISPFEGEMRRRAWHIITGLDTMMSLSVGLPRLLKESQSDTAHPRNLIDQDFDEDSTELPPSRPAHFQTPCQWLIARNKMISVFGAVSDFSTSVRLPSYADAMKLDKLLEDTYESLPENFIERPLEMSLLDDARTIFNRILLALTRLRAKCVLHYRYLASARIEEKFSYSRDTCMDACLCIQQYHCLVSKEIQPGGRLSSDVWRSRGPMINSVFISATTMLCLELNCDFENSEHIPLAENLRTQIIESLQNSYSNWVTSSEWSNESKRIVQVLDLILNKVQQQKYTPSNSVESMQTFTASLPQAASNSWDELGQGSNLPLDLNISHNPHHSAPYSNIDPVFLDLSQSLDEMLGASMNYPRMFDIPFSF